MKTFFQFAIVAILTLSGCNLINPSEQLPGYLYIKEIEFEGIISNSHKITEMWVYKRGDLVGVFGLPATIPILAKGSTDLKIYAGIKENGISSNRLTYPFYKPFEVNVDIQELQIDTIIPHFEYKENVVIPEEMTEQFESGFIKYQPFGTSDTSFVITSDINEIFEEDNSEHSGKIVFTPTFNLFQVESDDVALPSGKEIWAEFDYKSNNSFNIGLRPYVNGSPENLASALIVKNTNDENGIPQWNKIYVHLSSAAGGNASASSFSLYIQVVKDPNVNPLLFFDNIKVVHFN